MMKGSQQVAPVASLESTVKFAGTVGCFGVFLFDEGVTAVMIRTMMAKIITTTRISMRVKAFFICAKLS